MMSGWNLRGQVPPVLVYRGLLLSTIPGRGGWQSVGASYAMKMLTASSVAVVDRAGVEHRYGAPWARAVRLVDGGRAVVQGPNRIRMLWGRKSFPRYIRERDGFICAYCGQFGNTVDHVWPRSRGGICTPANCVCACRCCNGRKGSLSVGQFISLVEQSACTCYTYMNGITMVCWKHRILERAPRILRRGGNLGGDGPV